MPLSERVTDLEVCLRDAENEIERLADQLEILTERVEKLEEGE